MVSEISFAIVGCGNIGRRHALHIQKFARLVAVCDTDLEKAEKLGKQYGTDVFGSIDDLLAGTKAEVIAICTPNGLHAAHAICSLTAGRHVVCEKPMAISVADCRQMIEAAERYNRCLFIVKQNRFNQAVVAVKQAITEGFLGKILSFQINGFWNRSADYYLNSWHGTSRLDGGTLYTQFSHFIDIMYWLLGDIKTTYACLKNQHHTATIEIEDTGAVIFEMKSGAIGTFNYTVNAYNENMEGSFTLFGENGTVKIGGKYLNVISYQHIAGCQLPVVANENGANDYGTYKGSMSNHDKVYQNVIDVLKHGAAISTNAYEGLKTVEIIEQVYAANRMRETYAI